MFRLLNLNVTGFHNRVDNLINYEQVGTATAMNALDRYSLTNVSSARTQGIQSELQFGIARLAELRLGHQWLDTLDEDTNRPLMNRPEHQAHGSLQFSHLSTGLSLTTSVVWIGTRFFYEQAEDDERPDAIIVRTYKAKPFTNMSANLRWQATQMFGVFARGENLLNVGNPLYSSQRPRRVVFGLNLGK